VLDPSWTVEQLDLEDLVLAYMGQADAGTRRRRNREADAKVTKLGVAR
jgi:hypothetical protein